VESHPFALKTGERMGHGKGLASAARLGTDDSDCDGRFQKLSADYARRYA
jgi:hypothetical protein